MHPQIIGVEMASNTALIVGASRGLGLAMVNEYLKRGWHVTGTVRGTARTPLHDLASRSEGRLEVESVDVTDRNQVNALRHRLAERRFDLLFMNAGVNISSSYTISTTPLEEFVRLMVTNAYSPMSFVEIFEGLVKPNGTIGVMSSGLGSITNNSGSSDAYSASKASLNMLMKCFSARHAARPTVIITPGWVHTDMGGASAPLTIDDSIPGVVNAIESCAGKPGLKFLNYQGQSVPW
jgi:NAD(P)-dependent dehydrogenase (short-subunit alcohol dehydrogenase family)